jgi:hypothetical protein
MPFAMDVQLDVDATRGGLAELAYRWIAHLAATMPAASPGEIEVTRWPAPRPKKRELSEAGLAWLRAELERELPVRVYVGAGPGLMAAAIVHGDSPGWLQLSAYPPDELFADLVTQRRWVDALFEYADAVNPGYGQIDYHRSGDTALEARTRYVNGRPLLGECRDWLRGYSWLTIVPSELAGKLGGAAGLRDAGAFAEVRELTAGGVWLRATDTFEGWTLDTARPVFRALAPILRPGVPFDRSPVLGEPPLALVMEDPAAG